MSRRPRADHLFEQIAAFPNLLAAARRSAVGKRERIDVSLFLFGLERMLLRINAKLLSGRWQPGPYRIVRVRDPKPRMISVAPFATRVVHQALCAVVNPIFERGYIADSFASRKGFGQHRAIARYEHFRDRHPWVLRTDIYRYFPSIDHEVLKADIRRLIRCERTLALMDLIIDSSNPQETVDLYFPGDEVWTPSQRRRGLPLGNLTSQVFGNLYLNPLDHYMTEVLKVPGYLRYLDDVAVFADSCEALEQIQAAMQRFLDRRRLLLHPRKTSITPTSEPQQVFGYVVLPRGRRRLPVQNVSRAAQRIADMRIAWQQRQCESKRAGAWSSDDEALLIHQRIGSWVAHARHADTLGLRQQFFPSGWFCPRDEAPRRPWSCAAGRFLEQQSQEPALCQPQQQHTGQPQQQHRLAGRQYAV